MVTRMLAGIGNRRSGLTYCNGTATCCFYELKNNQLALHFIFTTTGEGWGDRKNPIFESLPFLY